MVSEPDTSTALRLEAYVCPACKGPLLQLEAALECHRCSQSYPIVDGLPDFVREDLSKSDRPASGGMIARLAGFYENLIGGFGGTTLPELVAEIAGMVKDVRGRVLDVACGPGTYGRRVASDAREVFGTDISMKMLRQGVAYTRREHVERMHFARARVESLPFADQFFDAALCCGSLHLFPETVGALREIGRTMKPGSTLAAMTFTHGAPGILSFRRLRERLDRSRSPRVFAVSEMERCLTAAGFDNFQPATYGSILVFRARKCA